MAKPPSLFCHVIFYFLVIIHHIRTFEKFPRNQKELYFSFAEQPISDKTLSRFRKRCYDYETLHGVDLYHDCVKDLSGKIAKIMKLNGRIRRMDSIMIESNIRFLSRMELIYTCISKLVVYLTKNYSGKISEQLEHYADSNDYNRLFYHQRNDDMEQIIQMPFRPDSSRKQKTSSENEGR